MTINLARVSPLALLAGAACFLLTFLDMSCSGQHLTSLSGVQLATGTTIEEPTGFGDVQKRQLRPEPLALLALGALVLGGGLCLVKRREGLLVASLLGAAALIVLVVLKSRIDAEVLRQGQGLLRVTWGLGYFSAAALAVVGASAAGAAWHATRPPVVGAGNPSPAQIDGEA